MVLGGSVRRRRARGTKWGLCAFRRYRHAAAVRRSVSVLLLAALAGCSTFGRPVPQHTDYHYADGRFHNPGTAFDLAAEKAEWFEHAIKIQLGLFRHARELPPDHLLDEEAVRTGLQESARAELAVTWIGHATTLIRIGDKWVLTDPAMLGTVGFGPFRVGRLAPARPSIDELPPIDAILISHADHDHLDLPTLRLLARRNPDTTVFVPLRNGAHVEAAGFRDVRELDWFQRDRFAGVEVIAVPANHGVRRPPYQINSFLWGGWVLKHRDASAYFSGDTGFGPIFEDIRKETGPVDVAIVPIGAYSPREMQKNYHTNPEEAAEIARIMGAPVAIGMHWGTFPLSGEPPTEQKGRFVAASGRGVSARALRVGETLVLR